MIIQRCVRLCDSRFPAARGEARSLIVGGDIGV